jgi:hypothetical protein
LLAKVGNLRYNLFTAKPNRVSSAAHSTKGEENAVVTFEAQCDTGKRFLFGFAVTH